MQEAEAKLKATQRQGAEKTEEAIRELQLAKTELEQILRQLREEEIERMLVMLEARFRRMLALQEEVFEGPYVSIRSPQPVEPQPRDRSQPLKRKESQIVAEVDKALLVLRDDGSAAAMLEAAGQMRDDVRQIVDRLARRRWQDHANIEEDVVAA